MGRRLTQMKLRPVPTAQVGANLEIFEVLKFQAELPEKRQVPPDADSGTSQRER